MCDLRQLGEKRMFSHPFCHQLLPLFKQLLAGVMCYELRKDGPRFSGLGPAQTVGAVEAVVRQLQSGI